jgi:hypothetical protein
LIESVVGIIREPAAPAKATPCWRCGLELFVTFELAVKKKKTRSGLD